MVSAYNAGDLRLIPGSGRSPGEGNDNPLQYSCLEKESHGQRSLAGYCPWIPKESDTANAFTFHGQRQLVNGFQKAIPCLSNLKHVQNVVLAYFHFPFKILWTFLMIVVNTACSLKMGHSCVQVVFYILHLILYAQFQCNCF